MAMTTKRQIPGVALTLSLLLLCACTREIPITPTPSGNEQVNEWIETTMRRYYLWEDEIPQTEKLNPTQDPESFFLSLLTTKDGKTRGDSHHYYSTIKKKTTATKSFLGEGYSFGFEYQYYYIQNLDKYALLTLYVIPDSPAEQQGLKRGDWIMEIGSQPVPATAADLQKALDTSTPATQTFATTRDPGQSATTKVELTAATVDDNPVFLRKIITRRERKIAYLVYNHFTSGPTDQASDETYNNTLREAFREFKAESPDEFILDLRYNGGGLVTSAQLLATMLAPATALDDVFCHLIYNGQSGSYPNSSLTLDSKYMLQGAFGANLDLSRLYIITSSWTASASEAVINGLKPYLGSITLVGAQTEGKNVGSVTFSNDKYEWELHPIVSRLSNKNNFSDYSEGFPPDVECDESKTKTYYELGDEQEYMLKTVLDLIASPTESAALRSASQLQLVPLYNSLDRKKTSAVVLDR
jgi:C-terminal processing protease CtpA/Prc